MRVLEIGATGFDPKVDLDEFNWLTKIHCELKDAAAKLIWYITNGFCADMSVEAVFNLTNIDSWFLVQIEELLHVEEKVIKFSINVLLTKFFAY